MRKKTLQPFSQIKNASLINSHAHSMVFDSNRTCYLAEGGYGSNRTSDSVIYSIDNNGNTKVFAVLPHHFASGMCELYINRDILFVGANSTKGNLLLAYSLIGNLLWTINTEHPIQSITNADDNLIISLYSTADNAKIASVSLRGSINWQLSVNSLWTHPIINNGRIFIGIKDGIGVYDFSGNLVKFIKVEPGIFPLKEPIVNSASALTHIPVANNTLIYSIDTLGNINKITKFPYIGLGFVWNNFSNDKIYAISRFNKFYKINISKNEIEFITTLSGNTISPPICIDDNKIIVGYDNSQSKSEICIVDNNLQVKAFYKFPGELIDVTFDSFEYIYVLAYTSKTSDINIYRIKLESGANENGV